MYRRATLSLIFLPPTCVMEEFVGASSGRTLAETALPSSPGQGVATMIGSPDSGMLMLLTNKATEAFAAQSQVLASPTPPHHLNKLCDSMPGAHALDCVACCLHCLRCNRGTSKPTISRFSVAWGFSDGPINPTEVEGRVILGPRG